MPIAVTLWYMGMDLTPLLAGGADPWSEPVWTLRKWISIAFGAAMILVALFVDLRSRYSRDYAFWLYLFGLATFLGGLTLLESRGLPGKLLYIAINAALVLAGAMLVRRAFAVFGGIGVAIGLGSISRTYFSDSLAFTVVLTFIGLAIIGAGVWWQRNEARLASRLQSLLPRDLRELLEARRSADAGRELMAASWRRALAGLLLATFACAASAQWQPTRPLRLVVPFAPGGQPDVVARTLAVPLARALGQPVVIENRPGAGGIVAAEAVAKSAPDGHTLLMGTNGPLAVSPALATGLPYDVARDFAFVTLVGTSPNLIAVHPSLGATTLAQVVAKAKAQPGRLNFASVGKGSVSQLSMESLNAAAGIATVHIPYNGGAAAVAALLAGRRAAALPQSDGVASAPARRQGSRRRADGDAALATPARRAHGGRVRLPGIRGAGLDGHRGPGEDAAGSGRAPPRRTRAHHSRAGTEGDALGPAVDRSRRLLAGGGGARASTTKRGSGRASARASCDLVACD